MPERLECEVLQKSALYKYTYLYLYLYLYSQLQAVTSSADEVLFAVTCVTLMCLLPRNITGNRLQAACCRHEIFRIDRQWFWNHSPGGSTCSGVLGVR